MCKHACMCVCIDVVHVSLGAETSNPAMTAFKLCYSIIKKALVSHTTPVADSSYAQKLIPSKVHKNIISTPYMPSGEKVKILLERVEKRISEGSDKVEVFANILRDQGSYLSVTGDDLMNTYREYLFSLVCVCVCQLVNVCIIHVAQNFSLFPYTSTLESSTVPWVCYTHKFFPIVTTSLLIFL